MAVELFSIAKASKSLVSPLSWFKAFMVGFKIFGILALGWAIYTSYIKPHFNPITTQQAETIQNITYKDSDKQFFVGVKLFGFKLGIGR